MASTIPTGTTVRRVAKTIIATMALIATAPAQAWTLPGLAGGGHAAALGPTMDRQAPKITIAAARDTIIAGLENLVLTLTREGAVQDNQRVALNLEQEQEWIQPQPYTATFATGQATARISTTPRGMDAANLQSGDLVATVDSVAGYDTGEASATVRVIALGGPAAVAFVEQASYTIAEDAANPGVTVVARMAPGMPRGADVRFTIAAFDGSALAVQDFEQILRSITLREEEFAVSIGRWQARRQIRIPLIDDDIREGTEYLRFFTGLSSGDSHGVVVGDSTGAPCSGCEARVEITDDEDIPEWGLSVSPPEIREEDEASSTATLAITNGKTFAADQSVTFAFAGTATEGADYTVAPADADGATPGHQVPLPSGSTTVDLTLTARDDDIEDSKETIEITEAHDGSTIGSTQTIRILNQEAIPAITLAASRDTIIGSMEDLVLTVTREAPLDESLTVTVNLAQDQSWLSDTSRAVTFAANQPVANLTIRHSEFSTAVVESGNLTAAVAAVGGYDASNATARVHVVSQEGPAIEVSFDQETYRFQEDDGAVSVLVIAEAAPGMPRGTQIRFRVGFRDGTAERGEDFSGGDAGVTLFEAGFIPQASRLRAQAEVRFTLVDDEIPEGTEHFTLVFEAPLGKPADLHLSSGGAVVEIADNDVPEFEFSLSEQEIREEGETSATATISITNGVTLAEDRMVTLDLGGDAIPGHDYSVTPADADEGAGHQVILSAGSSSVEATFTAIDDEREEPTERIGIRATLDGNTIGTGTIRIVDRFPGPRVEITFEDVQAPRDDYTAGVATGPFTTRITFSEPVEGFTQEDISWATHSLTTIDTTNIGVLVWDYAVVREGLEYTARMMPDQDGELWIEVDQWSAISVATGDGNQFGANSLWVEFPANRMLVEPRTLTVDEGDPDGAEFLVLLTSAPSGPVTVSVTGTDGTALAVDWPTVEFTLPYWNGGWAIRVTAADDANTANERLGLGVKATGGGYDGHRADLVINVRDDDGSASADASDEGALSLLEELTRQQAAAALFGEHDLSEAQLAALDLLGNRNGRYDLGDLLSWIARCERGEARCGAPRSSSSTPASVAAAALAAAGRIGRNGQRRQGRARSRIRRGSGNGSPLWHVVILLLAIVTLWSCSDGDGLVDPGTADPDPGYLTVWLTAPPATRDIGAMLVLDGPGIDSVRAPGMELFQSATSSPRQIVVAGTLATGPMAEFLVRDRKLQLQYRARLLEVTGEGYSLRDLSEYGITINR